MNAGLSRTVTTVLILAALIPAALLSIFTYVAERRQIVAGTGGKLATAAGMLVEKIDRNLFERMGDVQAFTYNPIARTGDAAALTALADAYADLYDFYDLLVIADAATGRVIAANRSDQDGKPLAGPPLEGVDVSGEAWFRDCLAPRKDTWWQGPHLEPLATRAKAGDGWTITFAYPVVDPASGKVVRVWANFASNARLVAGIAKPMVDSLRQELDAAKLRVQLIDRDDNLIFSSEAESLGRSTSADDAVAELRKDPQQRPFVEAGDVHGIVRSTGIASLGYGGIGLGAIIHMTADTVIAQLDGLRNLLVVAFLIIGGSATLVGILLARRLSRPVDRVAGNLVAAAGQIGSAAQQVSSSAQTLAQGASEQASSLEETSAALEELSAGTRLNADHARQADALAKEAQAASGKGEQEAQRIAAEVTAQMTALNEAVKAIRSATERAASVVETIDEIAFQTNLLALNAAVEAARAGEAGAGFAVVADEVRALAQRSAEEVKNSTALMQEAKAASERVMDSSGRIDAYLAKAVGQDVVRAFHEAVVSTGRVTQLMTEVATACDEQAKGIGQVNQAVADIDKVTQSNAAAAEQSAAASEELTSQAAELRTLVGELERVVRGAAAAARAAADEPPPAPLRRPTAALPARTTQSAPPLAARTAQRTTLALPPAHAAGASARAAKPAADPESVLPLGDAAAGDFSKF